MSIEFTSGLPAILEALEATAQERAQAGAQVIADHIVQQMEAPKSGQTHTIPGSGGVTYTASAPGEYPAVRTGEIVGSISAAGGEVGASSAEAPTVEGIRPFLARAAAECEAEVVAVCSEGWDK